MSAIGQPVRAHRQCDRLVSRETWLAKTRELKQGMMHKLLTGKIRLI